MKPFCSKVETVPQKDETIKIWNQRPKAFNHYYLVCTGLRSNNNRKKFVAFFQKPKKETVVPLSLLQYSLQTPQKCMPSRGTLLSKGPLLSNQNSCFFLFCLLSSLPPILWSQGIYPHWRQIPTYERYFLCFLCSGEENSASFEIFY